MKGIPLTIRLWKSVSFPGVTFACNSYSTYSFRPHFHDHYVIMVVDEGVNEGVCEKRSFQVGLDDILFVNPGEIHTGNSYLGRTLRYSALYIDPEFFIRSPLAGEHDASFPPVFPKLLDTKRALSSKLKDLFRCIRTEQDPFEMEMRGAEVFGELQAFTSAGNTISAQKACKVPVQRAIDFIKTQHSQPFTLADLTGPTGISPFHLIRSFREEVGITPFQFLRNYRVERAKKELRGKKSIAEVAVAVGFYDQSHFHKHFKLVTGITPGEFQRSQQ